MLWEGVGRANFHVGRAVEVELDPPGEWGGPGTWPLRTRRGASLPSRANRPRQEMFFVHPDKGLTHRHRIHLASAEEVRDINIIKR